MKLKTQVPINIYIRCEIKSIATLVAIALSRTVIGKIIYAGPHEKDHFDYLAKLNSWLEMRKLPKVAVHLDLTEAVLMCPLDEWGWNEEVCKAAITLAGLPVPNFSNNKQPLGGR